MSAPLSQAQWYHGSRRPLSESVEPGHAPNWSVSSTAHVYFTNNPSVAMGFARKGEGGTPTVYSVEPTGSHTKDRDYEARPGELARKSTAPLKVTGIHSKMEDQ